jgi:thiol-disulfide isomerase/thioredoxin
MTTTAAKPSSNKGFILIVLTVIVAGIALVAVLASGRDSAITGEPIGEVTVEGDFLATMPGQVQITDATTDPSYGAVAPTLLGTDFNGNDVTIEADGNPKAVYFITHWCPHCQAEVPLVQELIDEGQVPDGLEIYAVSTSVKPEAGNYPPQLWLSREKFSAPTLRDDEANRALASYGGGGFPFVVYLDGENKVIARSAGELGKDQIVNMWALTAASAEAEGASASS